MKIREITEEQPAATAQAAPTTGAQPAAAEPTQQQLAQGEQLLGTIDPQVVPPETGAKKLLGWLKQWPILDRVTDLLPQTRVIKAAIAAIDAIQAGDMKSAVTALASAGVGGAAGQALNQTNRAVQTGTALAQGNVTGAALAAGGQVAQVGRAANVVQNLAQGDTMAAANAAGGNVAKVANTVNKVQQYAPQVGQAVQTALAPQQQQVSEELARIKFLSGLK